MGLTRGGLVAAVLVISAILLSLVYGAVMLKHVEGAALVINYLSGRYGALPAVAPLRRLTIPSAAGELIITTSMQKPPAIPKPINYPEPPGEVVIASSNSTSPTALLKLGIRFQYLIVTSKHMLRSLYPIAAIHSVEGMNVLIATLNWIKTYFPARNLSKSIRLFARFAHYRLGAVYLLLGGDVNVVPTAYWYAQDMDLRVGENFYKATDQYYAFLDGSWDPNGNGKLLEAIDTNGDGIPDEVIEPLPDAVPDLYVGRLPAPNATAMNYLVSIELKYLTNPPGGNWLRRAILIAAIANFRNELGTHIVETDFATEAQYIAKHILIPHGYSVIRAYQDEGLEKTSYPHEYSLNHSNVDKLFRMGSALLLSIAHGGPQRQIMKVWFNDSNGDGIPEKNEIKLKTILSVGDNLSNGGRRPLTYLEGCLTGYFDYVNESLAEYVLNEAAIAVIASTRISYYQVPWPGPGGWLDQELTYLFWKELLGKANLTVGPALELSKYEYIKEHGGNPATIGFMSEKDILNYNLLGDPALKVWAKQPLRLELRVDRVVPVGKPLTAEVLSNGRPLRHALVAAYSSVTGELLSYGYTGSNGSVTLKIPVPEGSEAIYVVARKPGYTYGFAKVLIVYPHTPPLIRIISPSNTTAYRLVVPIEVNVTGVSGYISLIHVWIKGPGINYSKILRPNVSRVLVKARLKLRTSGPYLLKILVRDSLNNTVAKEVRFLVVNTPPMIKIDGIWNGTYVNRTFIQFNVSITDYSRITFAELILDGKILRVERNLGSSVLFNEEVNNLSEGLHALVVIARNSVGLWRRSVTTFYVDLTPPTINVYPNINNSVVNQLRIGRLIITCNDNYGVKHVVIWVDGKVTYNGTWLRLKEVNLKRLRNGNHTILVRAVDYAGNSRECIIRFDADSTPPKILLSGLRNGEYLNVSELPITIKVLDEGGIHRVLLYLNNKVIIDKELLPGAMVKSLILRRTINLAAEGRYSLIIKAYDLAGNSGNYSVTFVVDRSPPTVYIESPVNGEVTNKSLITVKVRASDNACLLSVKAYINGTALRIVNGEALARINSSGTYIIKAYAIDCAGNKASANIVFIADYKAPEVTVLRPKQLAVIKTPFQLSAGLRDNVGLSHVWVYVDNSLIMSKELSGRSAVIHVLIPSLSNGVHIIRVTAADEAGNRVNELVRFKVDNSPPTIRLLNSSVINAGIDKLLFKSNESLRSLKILVNGELVSTEKIGKSLAVTAEVVNGVNRVVIHATDEAGNSVTVEYVIIGVNATHKLVKYALIASVLSLILAVTSLTLRLRKSKSNALK